MNGTSAQKQELDPAEIARRAYFIWGKQGRPQGLDREHWLQAEAQLLAQLQSQEAPETPTKILPMPMTGRIRRPAVARKLAGTH